MAALLVLGPIFEADLLRNHTGFRPEMDAKMAVRQAFWHVSDHGRTEVVDADLSDVFFVDPAWAANALRKPTCRGWNAPVRDQALAHGTGDRARQVHDPMHDGGEGSRLGDPARLPDLAPAGDSTSVASCWPGSGSITENGSTPTSSTMPTILSSAADRETDWRHWRRCGT